MERDGSKGSGLRAALPLLVAGAVIEFVLVGGGIDTVGVFLNALAAVEGWSRETLSTGIAVGAVGAGVATPVVGLLIDRYGVRVPIACGTLLLAAGFGILAGMREPWQFVAANVLLGPGFAGTALLPITVAVTVRVPERTALALGIVGAGSSLGAVVLAPVIQSLVDAVGWQRAYWAMGSAVVLTPALLLFALPRGRLARAAAGAARPAERLQLGHELRRPGVGRLAAVLVLPGLAGFGIQVHLVPYLVDLGHAARFAAASLGAMIGIAAIGKLAGGWLCDRVGTLRTLRLAFGLELLVLALLPLAASRVVVAALVAGVGLAAGARIAVLPVIAIGILGRERFATLYGLLQLGGALAAGLAPIVPGVIFEATGSYALAVPFWITAMALGALVSLWLEVPVPHPEATAAAATTFAPRTGPV